MKCTKPLFLVATYDKLITALQHGEFSWQIAPRTTAGAATKRPCEEGDCANELKTGQASEDVLTWERLQVPCYNLHNNSHARSFLHCLVLCSRQTKP